MRGGQQGIGLKKEVKVVRGSTERRYEEVKKGSGHMNGTQGQEECKYRIRRTKANYASEEQSAKTGG